MAKKSTSEYKKIIKSAKTRMLRNDYAEAKKMYRLGLNNTCYVVTGRNLTKEEISGMCDKIREIENSSDDVVAIGKLVDKELLSKLSGSEQERYVLEIARLYRDIRHKLREERKKPYHEVKYY